LSFSFKNGQIYKLFSNCCTSVEVCTVAVRIADNVLQLGAVAVIEAQMFIFAQKFNRRTTVEFSTEPAILPNCCCAFVFLKIAFQKPFR
jgi:hypothetical protein